MGEVKLLGGLGYSPFVNRVEIALKLKGVEYESIAEDVKNKSPLLLQHNPIHKKIPVLIHDGKGIAESVIIVEYIDQVWEGPPILPKDPYQRAMARFWAKFIDEKCISATWKACWSTGEEQEKSKEEAMEALKFLEDEIKGKKFFGGDNIGFVDIAANFIGYWVPIISEVKGVHLITEENFPNLWRWMNDYCNDNFLKEILPSKDALFERFKSI
ncbi:probable glutathione S-transferase isoform X1 [Salvia hispanica]|uniref:probable glutathione S-transferase isoform X1 n=1 Tax=Salvia hispanica TaxID=49212 RepID=UPI0020095EFF|nr:probable glutathione S-transferase isoform X1 [Salvia hispanica]